MKKDYNILSYFNMRALFMGIGLSNILEQSKELFWLSILIGTIIGILLLFIAKIELKNNLINIFTSSILIIIALVIIINMISTMYLTEMPKFLVGLPLILLMLYILSKSEKVIFRISSILIVLNGVLYFASVLSLFRYVEWVNFSYTGTSIKTVLLGGLEFALYSVTPLLVTKDKKYAKFSLIKTYLVSSSTMTLLFFLTYGMLGANLVSDYRYPEYIILKKVSFFNSIANVHNIVSFVWIFDIFVLLLSCGNCIKNNLKHKKLIYIIIPALLIITSLFNKHYIAIIIFYKYSWIFLIVLFILMILFNKKIHFKE